jgi:translation initiation factor IF-2
MIGDTKEEAVAKSGEVMEKRVTTTVIRRRAKKKEPGAEAEGEVPASTPSEAPLQPAVHEEAAPSAAVAAKAETPQAERTAPKEGPVQTTAPQELSKMIAAQPGVKLASTVSEAERRIGVVGRIDLNAQAVQPQVKEKEDWKEKLKRGQRRKKSREEMDMEAIQRAGGLKHYAEVVEGDAPEAAPTPAMGDRVFQPRQVRKRKGAKRDFKKTQITERKAIKKVIRMEEGISVSALSQALGLKAGEIINKLMSLGSAVTSINDIIDVDTAQLIAEEGGFTVERAGFREEDVLAEPEAHASAENLSPRAPVVTVMGHVDHGKTSILDAIRKTNVTDGEAGGITQHIGAYEVELPKGRITFIDTPGHEAFTTMRARGAEVTDIVILVVAADDGIMPQTIEAIDHAKAAGVPIIVAINKIDKNGAQPDRVKQSMTEYGLVPEEWGGEVICVPTSAKTKQGIDRLLEMVLLQAEMSDLKADPTVRPKGSVIEARLDKGRGPVATVLVQEGTLKVGSYVVCGTYDGKVRAMFDFEGRPVDEAPPSKPVGILGLSGVPTAGDDLIGVVDEKGARLVAEQRRLREREKSMSGPSHVSLEDLSAQLAVSETLELNVILKGDVHGSIEAVSDALTKLSTEKVKLNVLHSAVGGIIESDIMLASASNAIVLGFNVQPDGKAKAAAENEKIEIRTYRIIYEMLTDVRKAMEGLLAPDENEVSLGQAEVRDIFKISKVGTIAGCYVVSGKIQRNARARILRDQVVVFDGKISSLKRFKDDAREVAEGFECGIGIENFNDIKSGDIIDAYIIEKKAAKL